MFQKHELHSMYKMPEAENALVAIWMKSSVWKWESTKDHARAFYC